VQSVSVDLWMIGGLEGVTEFLVGIRLYKNFVPPTL